jgi:hypothetical protein
MTHTERDDLLATIAALREEVKALTELAERRRQRLIECAQRIAVLEGRPVYATYGPPDLCS